jgi:hypothetical protein
MTFDSFLARHWGSRVWLPDLSGFSAPTYTAGQAIVSLRFDDSYIYNYSHVFPRLVAAGLTAGFGVPRALLGQVNQMTKDQLLEMQAADMEIMGHSRYHTNPDPATWAAYIDESEMPGDELRRLGLNVWSFVQPGAWTAAYNWDTLADLSTPKQEVLEQHFLSNWASIYDPDHDSLTFNLPHAHVWGVNSNGGTYGTYASLKAWVDVAIAAGTSLPLSFHANHFVGCGNLEDGLSLTDLELLLACLADEQTAGHLLVMTPTEQLFATEAV